MANLDVFLPPTHPRTHPLTHPPTHPPTHAPTHPRTHPPTHPPTHPTTHPLNHPPHPTPPLSQRSRLPVSHVPFTLYGPPRCLFSLFAAPSHATHATYTYACMYLSIYLGCNSFLEKLQGHKFYQSKAAESLLERVQGEVEATV